MRAADGARLDVGVEDVSSPCGARAITWPSKSQTNDSPANVRRSSSPHPVAERHEVAVLERRHAHLGLVEPLGPLADRAGLRHDHQFGAAERQRAHVLGVVAVVADGHADPADRVSVHRRAGVAGRVVALLVEARVVGDVDHARHAEQRAVGVDDRRAVEGPVAVALEEVEHDDHAELARLALERVGGRAGHGLGQPRTSAPAGRCG